MIRKTLMSGRPGKGGPPNWRISGGQREEAAREGKAVRLHVEKYNPAQRLYQRLGFKQVTDACSHFLMEWRAIKK